MSEWSKLRGDEAFSILLGRQRSPGRATGPNMTPYLRSANVGNGSLDLNDVKQMQFTASERARFRLERGDVLVSEGSASGQAVGMTAAWDEDLPGDVCFQNTVLRYRSVPGVSDTGFTLQWCRWAFESGAFRATASGTNILHIGSNRAAAMPVLLPPLPTQRRIVDVMSALDAQVEALTDEGERAHALYVAATSTLWLADSGEEAAARPLGDLMHLDIQRCPIDATQTYRGAGVLNAGQGLIDRGKFRGRDTGYSAMNALRANQVVMRKLTAWEGPITVVPEEFDGYLASNEFPTFTLTAGVSRGWVRHVCRTRRLWDEMRSRVTGTVQRRKRLSPDQLLSVSLPIPTFDQQEQAAVALDALEAARRYTAQELDRLRAFRSALLTALLNQEIEIPESHNQLLTAVS